MDSWNNNYHYLIDAIPKGVQVINRQGILVDANRAWLIYFGVTLEDVRGRHIRDIMQDMAFANPSAIDKEAPATEYTAPAALETLKTGLPHAMPFNKARMLAVSRPIYHPRGHFDYVLTTISENVNAALTERIEIAPVPVQPDKAPPPQPQLVGESSALLELRRTIAMVAPSGANVLVCGETGTGKEIIAGELHRLSGRNQDVFIRVNCAAIPENLIESELFGYERGAFTGALSSGKAGLIEAADGGTLFLDEINALPLAQQSKLLRVLESKAVQRVGGLKEKPVNFRLVAATNSDLRQLVAEKAFRADLFYRLNVIQIQIPPLRERPEDVRTIMAYYLDLFGRQYNKTVTVSPDAWAELLSYHWPGNVRELRNLAEYLAITATHHEITPAMLSAHHHNIKVADHADSSETPPAETVPLAPPRPEFTEDFSLKDYLDRCERAVLEAAYLQYGSSRRVADILKIDQSSAVRKKGKYGI